MRVTSQKPGLGAAQSKAGDSGMLASVRRLARGDATDRSQEAGQGNLIQVIGGSVA
jgi:hypothetical protein